MCLALLADLDECGPLLLVQYLYPVDISIHPDESEEHVGRGVIREIANGEHGRAYYWLRVFDCVGALFACS